MWNISAETWVGLIGGMGTWAAIGAAYGLGHRSDSKRQEAARQQLHIAGRYADDAIGNLIQQASLRNWISFHESVDCMRDVLEVVRAVPLAELHAADVQLALNIRRAAVATVAIVDAESKAPVVDLYRIGSRVNHLHTELVKVLPARAKAC